MPDLQPIIVGLAALRDLGILGGVVIGAFRFASMEQKLNDIHRRLGDMNGNLDTLAKEQSQHGQRISYLEGTGKSKG